MLMAKTRNDLKLIKALRGGDALSSSRLGRHREGASDNGREDMCVTILAADEPG
jgi:hypothetical protein